MPGGGMTSEREVLYILRAEAAQDADRTIREFTQKFAQADQTVKDRIEQTSEALQDSHESAIARLQAEADEAANAVKESGAAMNDAFLKAGEAAVMLGSGIAAIGLASEEDIQKLVQGLAKLKGVVDTAKGAIEGFRAMRDGLAAYRAMVVATTTAETARGAATARAAAVGVAGGGAAAAGGAAAGGGAAAAGGAAAGFPIVAFTAAVAALGLAAMSIRDRFRDPKSFSENTGKGGIGDLSPDTNRGSFELVRSHARAIFTGFIADATGGTVISKETAAKDKSEAMGLEHERRQALEGRGRTTEMENERQQRLEIDANKARRAEQQGAERMKALMEGQRRIDARKSVGIIDGDQAQAEELSAVNRELDATASKIAELTREAEGKNLIGVDNQEIAEYRRQLEELQKSQQGLLEKQLDVVRQTNAERLRGMDDAIRKQETILAKAEAERKIAEDRFKTDTQRFAEMTELERQQTRELAKKIRRGEELSVDDAAFAKQFQDRLFKDAVDKSLTAKGERAGARGVFSEDDRAAAESIKEQAERRKLDDALAGRARIEDENRRREQEARERLAASQGITGVPGLGPVTPDAFPSDLPLGGARARGGDGADSMLPIQRDARNAAAGLNVPTMGGANPAEQAARDMFRELAERERRTADTIDQTSEELARATDGTEKAVNELLETVKDMQDRMEASAELAKAEKQLRRNLDRSGMRGV